MTYGAHRTLPSIKLNHWRFQLPTEKHGTGSNEVDRLNAHRNEWFQYEREGPPDVLHSSQKQPIMKTSSILSGLKPGRFTDAVRRRGIRGLAYHALRRAGTMNHQALAAPAIIRINPMGFVCNHTCPMCWLQHLEPEVLAREKQRDRAEGMKLVDYQRFFRSIPPGVEEVNVVGGGEPLIHPQAVQIMAEVKRQGWRGSLITNGTLLKEPVSRDLLQMRWNIVRVSVHAGDAETYRQIQGVDRFETMKTNLKAFAKLRDECPPGRATKLGVFHVIQRENIDKIASLFSIAEEVGADNIEFDKIIPYDSEKWLTADELARAQEALARCARESKIPCNIDEVLPQLQVEETCAADHAPFKPAKSCSVGFDEVFVTSHGDVLPCCFSDEVMGNVRDSGFEEIWYGRNFSDFRSRLLRGKFAKYCIVNRCTLPGVLHN